MIVVGVIIDARFIVRYHQIAPHLCKKLGDNCRLSLVLFVSQSCWCLLSPTESGPDSPLKSHSFCALCLATSCIKWPSLLEHISPPPFSPCLLRLSYTLILVRLSPFPSGPPAYWPSLLHLHLTPLQSAQDLSHPTLISHPQILPPIATPLRIQSTLSYLDALQNPSSHLRHSHNRLRLWAQLKKLPPWRATMVDDWRENIMTHCTLKDYLFHGRRGTCRLSMIHLWCFTLKRSISIMSDPGIICWQARWSWLHRLRPEDSASQQSGWQRQSRYTTSHDGYSKAQAGSITGSDSSFMNIIRSTDPNSRDTAAIPTLTRRNLEKNHEETGRHAAQGTMDPDHRRCQLNDLKRTLSTLGVESSDDLLERMLPTSGETPMEKFLADKTNQTVQEKIYNRESDVTKDKRNIWSCQFFFPKRQ